MPLTLERLVYISSAAPDAFDASAIAQILGEARANNDRRDVTGALALGDREFLQAIEGRRHELDSLMDRRAQDVHHFDLQVRGGSWFRLGSLSDGR